MSFPKYSNYREIGIEWIGSVPDHWDILPIKRHFRLLTDKTDSRSFPVALENIESWTGRYLPTESEFEGEGVVFQEGDILFGKLRPYLAKAMVAPHSGEAIGDFLVMRPGDRVVGRFAAYQMLTREFISVVDGATFGTKMPRASWEFVGGMALPLPPKDEQVSIVAFLDRETAKIDALVAEQEKLIELLQEKRQAVISHAVTKGLNPDAPMKDSGVEWLGEVPEHWSVTRLDRLGSFEAGKAHEPFISDNGAYALANARFISTHGKAAKRCDVQLTPAREEDILMVMSDLPNGRALARAYHVAHGESIAVNQRVCRIRITSGSSRFYYYFLNRNPGLLWFNDGANQTHIPNSGFTKLAALEPPLDEQAEIAARLDVLDIKTSLLITNAEGMSLLLQERRSSLISAAVTGQIDVRQLEAN